MKLRELLEDITVLNSNIDLNEEVGSICYDSRKCEPGCAFVCIAGFKSDGHDYVAQALSRGAKVCIVGRAMQGVPHVLVENTRLALACMSSRWFDNPSTKFELIGVTGTNGKTSATYILKSILEEKGAKVGLIGTNQNMIGEKILETERTTPESYELQELFAMMVSEGVSYVVMEVSSHSLALNRVSCCEFDVGIFTNLTRDHLDFHESMEDYYKAKAKLFGMATVGIINYDDEHGKRLLEEAPSKSFSFSIGSTEADVVAKNVKMSQEGIDCEILFKDRIFRAELGIPGKFSVYNALSAVTCALVLGIEPEVITGALSKIKGVKGRAEVVPTQGRDFTVIIDYAHTPDGIYNIISAVRGFAKGRIVALFGCGGDRDAGKRPKMGHMAGSMADFCIVTSDNPRSEEPGAIIEDILPGVKETGCEYTVIENREEAIEYALQSAQAGDVILLLGKGHETYQILKDSTIHFDEREIVFKYLK